MLTVATARGSVQWHRYEYVRVRRPATSQCEKVHVGDLIDGLRIKLASGDAISVNDEWLTVQAVSWNAAWDRENEAARTAEKARREAEAQAKIDAEALAREERIIALASELLAKGLVKCNPKP